MSLPGLKYVGIGFLVVVAVVLVAVPALAGGVSVVRTVLTDNGDNDGYADTRETVTLRLVVRNNSGEHLTGLTARLTTADGSLACLTRSAIDIGELLVGEERATDEGFEFVVPAGVERVSVAEDLSVRFALTILSPDLGVLNTTPWIDLDLDLDVSGGGVPTVFFESFEGGFGAFTTMHLDESLNPPDSDLANRPAGVANADGWRCQYSDPDWWRSASYGNSQGEQCYPNANGQPDAFYFDIGTERAYSGTASMSFTLFLDAARGNTTASGQLEAVRSIEPINLAHGRVCSASGAVCDVDADCPAGEACVNVAPRLTFKQQISLMDHRSFGAQPERGPDRAIVSVQIAGDDGVGVGPWVKAYPFVNAYDTEANSNFFSCSFDPIDDGNTEEDFFDPSDPVRRYGPSSTCAPEFAFADQGDTDGLYSADDVGSGEPGSGLQGAHGIGTWVEPAFDLSRYRGRRIRVRFLMSQVKYSGLVNWEQAFQFNPDPGDDGWFIDDVTVAPALTAAAAVVPDQRDNSMLPLDIGSDADQDGIYDVCDNCPAHANASQIDADDDGVGNACDGCPGDALNDPDLDGWCAVDDNCPLSANPDQGDVDGDGSGDACDSCPLRSNPTQATDEDADGVSCIRDNCPAVANAGQADADGDGLGDACDACPDDPRGDLDGDGICGLEETCPFLYNPGQGYAVAMAPGVFAPILLSADESTIVFRRTQPNLGLQSMPAGGGVAVTLSAGTFVQQFEIADAASRVIYRHDQRLIRGLFTVPIQGGAAARLGRELSEGEVESFQVAPDGSRVVYQMWVGGPGAAALELLSAPAVDGPSVLLGAPGTGSGQTRQVRISADSTRVLFWLGGPELWVVPIDGGPATNLAPPEGGFVYIVDAGFSPDGGRVVFLATTGSDPNTRLYSVPADGGQAPVGLNPPPVAGGAVTSFKISLDGTRVFYAADQEVDNLTELYEAPILGGPVTKLSAPQESNRDVATVVQSPDGSRVGYFSRGNSAANQLLFTVPVGGGPAVEFGTARSFAFTPDGARLVFLGYTTDWRLGVASAAGGETTFLDATPSVQEYQVSADGSRITFAEPVTSPWDELRSVPIDGGQSVNISDGVLVRTAFIAGVLPQTHDGAVTYWTDSDYRLFASWLTPDPDGDGLHRACDCDEDYRGGIELNDGLDNQCPGAPGFGLVDEISGTAGFRDPADPNRFSWTPQAGATEYAVVRSGDPTFNGDCACTRVVDAGLSIAEQPPEDQVYFYLPRAITPSVGSAGADGLGNQRGGNCLTTECDG